METSILKSIKAVLGYELDDAFDVDVMMHINTVFATLTDLGIGPPQGFMIEDDSSEWLEFYGEADLTLNRVQTYVYLRVKSYFDPPKTPYHIAANDAQIAELENRILVNREVNRWLPQTVVLP